MYAQEPAALSAAPTAKVDIATPTEWKHAPSRLLLQLIYNEEKAGWTLHKAGLPAGDMDYIADTMAVRRIAATGLFLADDFDERPVGIEHNSISVHHVPDNTNDLINPSRPIRRNGVIRGTHVEQRAGHKGLVG